jgi:hypothetical protein
MPCHPNGLAHSADLVALLEQAGVHKNSLIRVTGPSGLSALLWLCRHDYEEVGYLRPGLGCPHEEADALIVAHTCDPAFLARLLAGGPHVREGGVLVFQSALPAAEGQDSIARRLAAAGYRIERRFQGEHRQLHVARRLRDAVMLAA